MMERVNDVIYFSTAAFLLGLFIGYLVSRLASEEV